MTEAFQLTRYATIGIHRSRHAVALLRATIAAGIPPSVGLISAETEDQLDASRALWSRDDVWSRPGTALAAAAARGDIERSDEAVEHVYRDAGIPYLFVPGFESDITCRLMERAPADAFVLAEAPILRGRILDCVGAGLVNLHAAPLPEYRGNHTTYWALYHDEPLHVTAHLVDKDIDAGPILARRRLPVVQGDNLAAIDDRAFDVCGELLADVLHQATTGGVPLQQQAKWQGRTFYGSMPEDLIAECEQRLAAGSYTHYA